MINLSLSLFLLYTSLFANINGEYGLDLSDNFVIHHESKPGPFEKENDSIFPEWAPDGSDPKEVEDYVRQLAAHLPEDA